MNEPIQSTPSTAIGGQGRDLASALTDALGDLVRERIEALGETTIVVRAGDYLRACTILRDEPSLAFDQLIDLCGVDYLDYGEGSHDGPRFATVVHLLSLRHNRRVRVRSFSVDDDFPTMSTLMGIWPAVGWFEREAFDLFGIVYEGHPDLRRILTDYGFVGHPFRKDFPVSGYTEMRYDEEQRRVIYQPVTIEPRNNVPRVIREDGYGADRKAVMAQSAAASAAAKAAAQASAPPAPAPLPAPPAGGSATSAPSAPKGN